MNQLLENDRLFPDIPEELHRGYPSREYLGKLRTIRCILPISKLVDAVLKSTEIVLSTPSNITRLDCMVDCPTQLIISYNPRDREVQTNSGSYNVFSKFYLVVIKEGVSYNLSSCYTEDELLIVYNTARRNVARVQEDADGGITSIDTLVNSVPDFNL